MKGLLLLLTIIFAVAGLGISQNNPAAGIPYLGKRSGDPTCNASRKGFTYYNTSTNKYRFCDGSTWSDLGGGGITVGTTTSNGTANTVLKTNGSSAVADAAGVTQPSGNTLKLTSQNATDVIFSTVSSASQSGDVVDLFRSDGTTKHFWITQPSGVHGPEMHFKESNFNNEFILSIDNSGNANLSLALSNQKIGLGGRPQTGQYKLAIQGREDDSGGNATEIKTQSASTVGMNVQLAASPTGNAINVTSNGGSAGDLYSISSGGFTTSAGDKRVSSNVTNATATMTNIADLTLTLAASGKYAGTFSFLAKNSTAAEGIQFDFNGSSATITGVQFGFTAAPPGVTLGTTNSTALATAITATTATTTDVWYTVNFIIVVNAAGTIIPRVAEVSHTSGTVTVEAGSFSNVRKYN